MATVLYIILPIIGWAWFLIKIGIVWGIICTIIGVTTSIVEEIQHSRRAHRWDTSSWTSH